MSHSSLARRALSRLDGHHWVALAYDHAGRVGTLPFCFNISWRGTEISERVGVKKSPGLLVEAEFLHIAAQEHVLVIEVTA